MFSLFPSRYPVWLAGSNEIGDKGQVRFLTMVTWTCC